MSVKAAVSKMQELVDSMSTDLEEMWSTGCQAMTQLQYLLQYQEDILLDPKTAHPMLRCTRTRRR